MSTKKFIISGGGTGGHIYPAIAIANALKEDNPNHEILFIGAKGKMEMEKVPKAGFKIIGLWISGFQRNLTIKNLLFPIKLIFSLLRTAGIIIKYKPDVVIGVGGFASGPTLRMADWLGYPIMIQEQNSFPGMTNRILAPKTKRICVAYPGLEKFFSQDKLRLTGNPVRKDIINLEGKKEEAVSHFNLIADKKTLLIIGGSLGARSINLGVQKYLNEIVGLGVQVIWQTGKNFEQIEDLPEVVKMMTFIERMDLAYAAADFVVSRAGALAVSEIALVKIPSILVPYPHASENHQFKNAEALVNGKAAVLLEDDKVDSELLLSLTSIVNNTDLAAELKENIESFGFPNSANDIAKEVLSI
jgi:UDP-N-acetylglucosamine--N-acetylmuramyl-(pentapeptide) pyrophosphoryl-undecaprenol N-acetylglucosamine transferase